MEAQIDTYFKSLKGKNGDKPPTLAGLALALGFVSRQSLFDYSENELFACAIKKAKARIEEHHEGRMSGTSPVGSIFWLKNNAGYVDKQEIETSGSLKVSWPEELKGKPIG